MPFVLQFYAKTTETYCCLIALTLDRFGGNLNRRHIIASLSIGLIFCLLIWGADFFFQKPTINKNDLKPVTVNIGF